MRLIDSLAQVQAKTSRPLGGEAGGLGREFALLLGEGAESVDELVAVGLLDQEDLVPPRARPLPPSRSLKIAHWTAALWAMRVLSSSSTLPLTRTSRPQVSGELLQVHRVLAVVGLVLLGIVHLVPGVREQLGELVPGVLGVQRHLGRPDGLAVALHGDEAEGLADRRVVGRLLQSHLAFGDRLHRAERLLVLVDQVHDRLDVAIVERRAFRGGLGRDLGLAGLRCLVGRLRYQRLPLRS